VTEVLRVRFELSPSAFKGNPVTKKMGFEWRAVCSKLVQKDYVDNGIPVIRGCNLSTDFKFRADEFVFVTPRRRNELLPNNAHSGDLVFTSAGNLRTGRNHTEQPTVPQFVISQSQMKLSVNPEMADSKYVYYYFRSSETVDRI